jgi:DNA-directed RNA polymerase specialized sigma24 family protein
VLLQLKWDKPLARIRYYFERRFAHVEANSEAFHCPSQFTAIDADAAAVAKLRLFAGLSVEQIAEIQRISPRTAKRNWAQARAWLGRAGFPE